jgi:GDP-L-fucose synthase
MNKKDKIYIAGHKGLVGSALLRKLKALGFTHIITRTRKELDLFDAQKVTNFFQKQKPDYVFLAAAKVGGIHANNEYPADFIFQNITIQNNIIHNAYLTKVKKLLFLGSSCIYPKHAPQPIKEEYLLTSELEPTNEPYAIAKITGIKMCQAYNKQYSTNFISVMPTNLYGPNDNFDLETAHVLPALLRKFHEAKINNSSTVTVWGSGKPKREFMYVDDLADACIFLMQNYNDSEIINIGTDQDITIRELAEKIKKIVDFKGKIIWDKTKPDGTPRKLLDIAKIKKLGWSHKVNLVNGLEKYYKFYIEKYG